MNKDKEDPTETTNDAGNLVDIARRAKKDAYYVISPEGSGLIIMTLHLKENNKDNNYIEWAKAIRLALRSKRKLGFIDGLILMPTDDPDEKE